MSQIENIIWLSNGTLSVVAGCMFAGKTDELIRRLSVIERAKKKAVVFKPWIDNRYGKKRQIITHHGIKLEANLITKPEDVTKILEKINNYDVVGFDEINFLGKEFWPIIKQLLKENKTVICAGLDKDYWNENDSLMSKILIRADSVTKLFAICSVCGGIATRTQRIKDGHPVSFWKPKILIGGEKSYEPRCNSCYIEF